MGTFQDRFSRRGGAVGASSAAFLSAFAALLAAGCGGAGGGTDTGEIPGIGDPPVVTSRSFSEAAATGFAPNYREGLETLRRWPKTGIRVFVRAVGDGRDRTVPAREAISLWEQATEGFFTFELVGIEEKADVVINFVDPARLSEGAVGYTTVTYQTPGDRITHAEIYINKEHPDGVLTQIASHELGHALGVDGHSRSDFDLMYPRLRLPTRLSDSDVNTVFLGYQEVAASATGGTTAASTASDAVTRSAVATHEHTVTCGTADH